MSELEWKRIRVDWEELLDAFKDSSDERRYYFDRETGAVHFFSSYLDNEEEEEDERAITGEDRYVPIPRVEPSLSTDELSQFVASLRDARERKALTTALRSPGGDQRFRDAVEVLPGARRAWRQFSHESLKSRIEQWLTEVSVEPL